MDGAVVFLKAALQGPVVFVVPIRVVVLVIELWLAGEIDMADVPFADHAGLVTGAAQDFGDRDAIAGSTRRGNRRRACRPSCGRRRLGADRGRSAARRATGSSGWCCRTARSAGRARRAGRGSAWRFPTRNSRGRKIRGRRRESERCSVLGLLLTARPTTAPGEPQRSEQKLATVHKP